jgi:hypothetical protein
MNDHRSTDQEAAMAERHPTTELLTCCGHAMPIDDEMVPLVTALWRAGLHTQSCCQGDDDDHAYLSFPDVLEADRFAQLVMHGGATPNHVAGVVANDGTPVWMWSIFPRFPLAKRAHITVRFPPSEIGDIVRWIAAAGSHDFGEPQWPEVEPIFRDAGCVLEPELAAFLRFAEAEP